MVSGRLAIGGTVGYEGVVCGTLVVGVADGAVLIDICRLLEVDAIVVKLCAVSWLLTDEVNSGFCMSCPCVVLGCFINVPCEVTPVTSEDTRCVGRLWMVSVL